VRPSDAVTQDVDLVVQSSDMALLNVASLAASGGLDLSPRFQRRNRWTRDKQSQLIESFLLNVPVPPVYLAEEERGVFAVIDGKQRLTSIASFFNGEYRLSGLTFRPDLEGRSHSDLDPVSSSTLSMRSLRAVMIMRQTPQWVKHEVFLRLNTGGQPLNAQEIRNVAYASPLNDRIIQLAEHPFLHQQLKIRSEQSPAYRDMTDVELVVRFFAMTERWREFGGDLRRALDEFMERHYKGGANAVNLFAHRFSRALEGCAEIWSEHAFQRFDGRQWRDQLIGGVYDAQMVAIDALPDSKIANLARRRKDVVKRTEVLFRDPEFDTAVRLSTNTSARVRYRVEAVMNALASIA
jgi:hypothetical protein